MSARGTREDPRSLELSLEISHNSKARISLPFIDDTIITRLDQYVFPTNDSNADTVVNAHLVAHEFLAAYAQILWPYYNNEPTSFSETRARDHLRGTMAEYIMTILRERRNHNVRNQYDLEDALALLRAPDPFRFRSKSMSDLQHGAPNLSTHSKLRRFVSIGHIRDPSTERAGSHRLDGRIVRDCTEPEEEFGTLRLATTSSNKRNDESQQDLYWDGDDSEADSSFGEGKKVSSDEGDRDDEAARQCPISGAWCQDVYELAAH